ncbi:hypothetical protein GCM10010156_59590 [Planobispora rosea]|uniref:Anti-sigma factor antagonist n=1 Tax=Planobispora rosea TaxID=35762 RepID=A0A8J3S788_PLARO|nr:STAS domain-containing protein [Planobispora rosea]GGS93414.1 hypothetical protein GCM10010156_59590 [Planobispora rosea]GIH87261.1 hypothetical protein Pro02_56690 [Planobispora rosea]
MAFTASFALNGGVADIELTGELDASTAYAFHDTIEQAAAGRVTSIVIQMRNLTYMSSAGLRSLMFAQQKLGEDVRITIAGAAESVARIIRLTGLDRNLVLVDG